MGHASGTDPDSALARAQTIQPNEKTLPVIWIAMMFAIVAYGVVAWAVAPRIAAPVDQTIENWILLFLSMTAGLHILVVFLLRQMIAALAKSSYVTFCVIRWALMESIGIYGLVLVFVGVDPWIAGAFLAVALMLLASAKPGEGDRAVFVRQYE